MKQTEIELFDRYLALIESSEVTYFHECLEKDMIESYKLFGENGVFVMYKEEKGYSGAFAFGEVIRDYGIALYIEQEMARVMSLLKEGDHFSVDHDLKQIYLHEFLFKAKFKKPRTGVEYIMHREKALTFPEKCDGVQMCPYDSTMCESIMLFSEEAFYDQEERSGEGHNEINDGLRERYNKMLESGKTCVFVKDGDIAAYARFDGAKLDLFVVNPKYQHNGYGRKLLPVALRNYFEETDHEKINMYTYLINFNAQKLYEAVGFEKGGEYSINRL